MTVYTLSDRVIVTESAVDGEDGLLILTDQDRAGLHARIASLVSTMDTGEFVG